MAKESLEMLFRELKELESSSTDATQVYQVATLLTHAHSTLRVISVYLFHSSSLPCSTHPSSSHHYNLHTTPPPHTLIAGLPPSPLSNPLLPFPSLSSSNVSHILLPCYSLPLSLPSPPLPSPPTDCRSSGRAAGPRAYCIHPHPLAVGSSEGDQPASGVWLTGHNEDLWHD